LLLIRKAIRERWDVPEARRMTLVDEIYPLIDSADVRLVLAVIRVFLAAEKADLEERSRDLLTSRYVGSVP
jgi:hypothetical protein